MAYEGGKAVFPTYNSIKMLWELKVSFLWIWLRNTWDQILQVEVCRESDLCNFLGKKQVIYIVQSFIHLLFCYFFFIMDDWCYINMKIFKHSRSSYCINKILHNIVNICPISIWKWLRLRQIVEPFRCQKLKTLGWKICALTTEFRNSTWRNH